MHIALYPGCFDPIHKQHFKITKTVCQEFSFLKEIWVLINENSQEKKILTPFSQRLKMLEIIFSKHQKIKIYPKPISFYTTVLVQKLKKQYPNYNFYLVLGSDQINRLDEWANAENLSNLVTFICVSREGHPINKKILQKYSILEMKRLSINNFNSNEIKRGWNWKNLDLQIQKYIIKHSLYFDNILTSQIKNAERIQHCYNVVELTQTLMKRFDLSAKKSEFYLAALFHDITKEWSVKQHQTFLIKHNLKVNKIEKLPKAVWHSFTSAYFVKKELQITESIIFDTIKYHTTARDNFSDFSKIVFIADKLELEKKDPFFNKARELLKNNSTSLDILFKETLHAVVEKLNNQKKPLTINTKKACKAYLQNNLHNA